MAYKIFTFTICDKSNEETSYCFKGWCKKDALKKLKNYLNYINNKKLKSIVKIDVSKESLK